MGASESRNKDPDILNVFTAEETSNLHQLFLRIVGNQQWLTKPFLEVSGQEAYNSTFKSSGHAVM